MTTLTAIALAQLLIKPVAAAYTPGLVPWFNGAGKTCQVYRSVVGDLNCFTFGPTETWQEWAVDFFAVDVPVHNHPLFGPVHLGLWLDSQEAIVAIAAALASLGWPSYYFADHSKGAGQSVLAHAAMMSLERAPLATAAFEPPCVGGPMLTRFLAGQTIVYTETHNARGFDTVTQVPEGPTWEHQGERIVLQVPDAFGIAQRHEIAAVLAAVQALPGTMAGAAAALG